MDYEGGSNTDPARQGQRMPSQTELLRWRKRLMGSDATTDGFFLHNAKEFKRTVLAALAKGELPAPSPYPSMCGFDFTDIASVLRFRTDGRFSAL